MGVRPGETLSKFVEWPRPFGAPGAWTAIFDHGFVQIPMSWTVRFESADGESFTGEVQEKRSSWIFPNPPTSRTLESKMRFQRGWWNTFFTVKVKPDRDLMARID
jgi:hypothetical protein